jgi:transposase
MGGQREVAFSGGPERSDGTSENGASRRRRPDPEVKPTRRRFTAEYKLEILREAEACRAPGELGALLRREGLYSSHLTAWRKQQRTGLVEKKRGRRPERRRSDRQRIEQLERENAKLRRRLEQAETVISVQKKVFTILESMKTEDAESSSGND